MASPVAYGTEAARAASVVESQESASSTKTSDGVDEKHIVNVPIGATTQSSGAGSPTEKSHDEASSEETGSYDEDEEEEDDLIPRAGFRDIYRYASKRDVAFNVLGVLTACAAGAAQPLMTIVFGNLTTNFLRYTNSVGARTITARSLEHLSTHQTLYGRYVPADISSTDLNAAREALKHAINVDALLLVYIGVAIFVTTYIYMATFVHTGEVITRRLREAYLAAVLRQEVAYFDTVGAGEITTRIQSEIQLIQDGISDKVPMSFMFVATFMAGFVVAYIKSWQLSLAMSSILPCIIGAGAAMNVFITKYQQIELQYVAQAA